MPSLSDSLVPSAVDAGRGRRPAAERAGLDGVPTGTSSLRAAEGSDRAAEGEYEPLRGHLRSDADETTIVINTRELWSHRHPEKSQTSAGDSTSMALPDETEADMELDDDDRDHIRLKEEEAKILGIKSPWRIVRSRYYVASSSHLLSLFNLLLHGSSYLHSRSATRPIVDQEAVEEASNVTDAHYLSHLVFRVWEKTKCAKDDPERVTVDVLFSPGAKDGFGQNDSLLESDAKSKLAQLQTLENRRQSDGAVSLQTFGSGGFSPKAAVPPAAPAPRPDASERGCDPVPPYCELHPLLMLTQGYPLHQFKDVIEEIVNQGVKNATRGGTEQRPEPHAA
eukprot:Polyplicarium_translucidae@DN335_c0_g1_i1.p1